MTASPLPRAQQVTAYLIQQSPRRWSADVSDGAGSTATIQGTEQQLLSRLLQEYGSGNVSISRRILGGWEEYQTGGGCRALRWAEDFDSDGPHYLATMAEEASIPEAGSDVSVGFYSSWEDPEGQSVTLTWRNWQRFLRCEQKPSILFEVGNGFAN